MAKTQQPAWRRGQISQQKRDGSKGVSRKKELTHRRRTNRRKDRSRLYLVVGTLAVIVVILGLFVAISRISSSSSNAQATPSPADPVVVQLVTGVSPSTWQQINTGGLSNPWKSISGQPSLIGPHGHPELFYVGADYCPYCAAERWAMVNALSRFGTFGHLNQIQSAEDSISTFSFYQSTYSSQYLDFVPVELMGNTADSSGHYATLQPFQDNQEKIFTTYDSTRYFQADQSFPFLDLNNQYLAQGASFDLSSLLDSQRQSFSWQDIASSLNDPASSIAQNVLGAANYLTAALCSVTQQQPGDVCNTPVIQQIERTL